MDALLSGDTQKGDNKFRPVPWQSMDRGPGIDGEMELTVEYASTVLLGCVELAIE